VVRALSVDGFIDALVSDDVFHDAALRDLKLLIQASVSVSFLADDLPGEFLCDDVSVLQVCGIPSALYKFL